MELSIEFRITGSCLLFFENDGNLYYLTRNWRVRHLERQNIHLPWETNRPSYLKDFSVFRLVQRPNRPAQTNGSLEWRLSDFSHSEHIGCFENRIVSRASHHIYTRFIYGNFIYYRLTATRTFAYFTPNDWSYFIPLGFVFFDRHTFFRFDITTGHNEEVSLEHFVGVMHSVYREYWGVDVRINPDFAVRE